MCAASRPAAKFPETYSDECPGLGHLIETSNALGLRIPLMHQPRLHFEHGRTVGIGRLTPVEQDVALLMHELEGVQAPPRNCFNLARAGSGQRLDQSDRTTTTDPSSVRPRRSSQLAISLTCKA